MSLASTLIPVGLELARLGIDAASGKHQSTGDVARKLVDLGLQLVPYDELKMYLTEAGRTRGEFLADVAERVKFGPDDDEEEGK